MTSAAADAANPWRKYKSALLFQVIHAALCVLWNGVGLWQTAHLQPTIGPTASWGALVGAVVLAAGLMLLLMSGSVRWYLALSFVAMLLALLAVWGGLTKDASLWPSEFWRWAGIAVNAVGLVGFPLALCHFRNACRLCRD